MKKQLLLAGLLATSLTAGTAFAERDGCDRKRHHGFMGGGHHKAGKMMEREFSADQVHTLVEARLIMKGNPNLKVGKVSAIRDGFKVTIVTQDDSLVEEYELAKNAMPREKYERMLKRMEERKERKEAKERK